ncbi:hypothetical protein VRB37_16535 [Erwinia billingiae]|uniref:hypothetical protein n=1 Tax=Erwinia billingiae TaxID=182337 RepID=UPI0030CFE941
MEHINKDTQPEELHKFLTDSGYTCGEIQDNAFMISMKKVKTNLRMMPSGNILFMLHLKLKDDIEEIDVLRKINEINFKITSGTICLRGEFLSYCFTLITPYGMGFKGFKSFIDYHMFLISYMAEELGLSEITQ